jgi:hypothetical protein
MKLLKHGKMISSPGGSFSYEVMGPVCMLYDREELPWPCCRLSWKGKEPSWRRVGPRYVPDISSRRCHSYSVVGRDIWGNEWTQVVTLFYERLDPLLQSWWYWKQKPGHLPPRL